MEKEKIARSSGEPTEVRILDAAVRCFGRSGFDGATIEDIARDASVSKALVHYHFQTKDQLLLEVQARAFRRLADGIARLAESGAPSVARGLEGLDRVWDLLVAFRDQIPFSLEMWSQSSRKPELRERLERFTIEMLTLIEAGARQTLGPAIDRLPFPPPRLARALLAILWGLSTHAYFAPSLEAAHETYRDLRAILERAMREGA